MEMPKLTDAHRRLDKLVGHWIGEEKIYPSPFDPQGGMVTARIENRLALNGFAVVQEYEQEKNGAVVFRGHGVFRWEAMQQCYEMHWFDSLGFPPSVFRGNWTGEVLTVTSQSPQGHNRATFDFGTKGHYKFLMEVSPDGKQWFPFMDGQYSLKR